jgi:hypothetical protein
MTLCKDARTDYLVVDRCYVGKPSQIYKGNKEFQDFYCDPSYVFEKSVYHVLRSRRDQDLKRLGLFYNGGKVKPRDCKNPQAWEAKHLKTLQLENSDNNILYQSFIARRDRAQRIWKPLIGLIPNEQDFEFMDLDEPSLHPTYNSDDDSNTEADHDEDILDDDIEIICESTSNLDMRDISSHALDVIETQQPVISYKGIGNGKSATNSYSTRTKNLTKANEVSKKILNDNVKESKHSKGSRYSKSSSKSKEQSLEMVLPILQSSAPLSTRNTKKTKGNFAVTQKKS